MSEHPLTAQAPAATNAKPTYTIAVTGLNAIDSLGPGVSVIRGLRDAASFNLRIIGIAYETLEPGMYMRELVDKVYITDKGKAWAGVTLDDPKLLEITRDLMAKTQWRGPLELEFMKTNEDDYYLIEINPRFPAWVYLTVGAGQNQPEMLVNLAMGREPEPQLDYTVGKLFIRYSWDMIVDLKEFEQISTTGEL
jgi:Predicted ATP-grasp enzyme